VAPNTFSVAWETGKSLTDNGLGNLTGNGGTGKIVYSTGKVTIYPTILPLGGSTFTFNYSYGDPLLETFSAPVRDENGYLNLTLQYQNVVPKSVEMEFNVLIDDYDAKVSTAITFIPNRSNWVDPIVQTRDNGSGVFNINYTVEGEIDYVNGSISFKPDLEVQIPKPVYSNHPIGSAAYAWSGGTWIVTTYRYLFDGWEYIPAPAKFPLDETGYVKVHYRATDSPQSAVDEEHAISDLHFDLTSNYNERIVANSVRFVYGSKTYFDNDGALYHSLDPATGSATEAGTINYETGLLTIEDWTTSATNSFTLYSLLTEINAQVVDEITFRTPSAPLRPGSLYVQANQLDGTQITCTADLSGSILTAAMDGTVDYETGIVHIRFGKWVTPAGHENDPWYSAEAINEITGKIFQPAPIYPESLRYNCVIYSYLPISADILGLDPVRLPFDGRVPIFKPSDLLIVHNTDRIACSNPLSGGSVIDCQRQRLAAVEVRDSLEVVVDPDLYTEDLDAGTVTFDNPLDLGDYTQPLYVYHTIEDMVQCVDVEITGRLGLSRTLSHDYDKDVSYVSSALIMKIDGEDLFARWTNPFSQQTWTSVWSDSRIGNAITPQYNYNQHPIEVTNQGCIQQRWALIFTSSSAFNIVGETLGQIDTGTINEDCAPINPNVNVPYFTLRTAGFGGGWSTGNVIRFNTIGANYPVDIARTVLQSTPSVQSDKFRLAIRGDIDQ
jgi:hypothetical protein